MSPNSRRPGLVLTRLLLCVFCTTSAPVLFSTVEQDVEVAGSYECARIYADDEGLSHFEDVSISFRLTDFAPPAPPISISEPLETGALVLISSPSGWFGEWHPSPQKQIIVIVSGILEVEVSDGEVRRFEPGHLILVEDTTGKGHRSRVVSEDRAYCLAIEWN